MVELMSYICVCCKLVVYNVFLVVMGNNIDNWKQYQYCDKLSILILYLISGIIVISVFSCNVKQFFELTLEHTLHGQNDRAFRILFIVSKI